MRLCEFPNTHARMRTHTQTPSFSEVIATKSVRHVASYHTTSAVLPQRFQIGYFTGILKKATTIYLTNQPITEPQPLSNVAAK
jgi:hypothetical protein